MLELRNTLRRDNFLARGVTFGMIPLCWRVFIGVAKWLGEEDHLLAIGIVGIWIGVVIGHQMYYRWIFPEKNVRIE